MVHNGSGEQDCGSNRTRKINMVKSSQKSGRKQSSKEWCMGARGGYSGTVYSGLIV